MINATNGNFFQNTIPISCRRFPFLFPFPWIQSTLPIPIGPMGIPISCTPLHWGTCSPIVLLALKTECGGSRWVCATSRHSLFEFVVVLVIVHVAALAQCSHWSPWLHDRCSWVTVQWVKVSPGLECHEHSLGEIFFFPSYFRAPSHRLGQQSTAFHKVLY